MIKKIAVLTSGGDAPGMNAALRAVIRAGLFNGFEMHVIYNGYKGLVDGDIHQVSKDFTADIINRGGTIIKSARLPEFKNPEVVDLAIERLRDYDIDALVGIGGDGTYRGLLDLAKKGFPVVGIPASIDNDVASTDYTIGFMTALGTICDCIDKIKDTSNSHQRCSIIEVMGRHCGDLAIYSSIAEGAELCLTAEHPYPEERIFKKLRKMKAQKKGHAIVIVSENLLDVNELGKKIEENTGFATNIEVLGHLQRGGAPTAFDRILASRMGEKAIDCLMKGEVGVVISSLNNDIVSVGIEEALSMPRDTHESLIKLVKELQ